MKSAFFKYLSEKEWLIKETELSKLKRMAIETVFTLGNGYLGSRGIYEEIPDGTEPGTYMAGVYDSAASMVSELVNLPNPIDFRIAVEGEKLDLSRTDILENERILDLKNGLLVRRTIFSDTKKRRFLYESIRFFSFHNPHIGAMRICLTALDATAKIIVQDTVDDSVTNIGGVLEGRKRHTQLVNVSMEDYMNYLCVKTFTNKIWVGYATYLAVSRNRGEEAGTLNKIFNMSLKKGETVCFTKIISIHTSRHISYKKLMNIATRCLKQARYAGFENLFKNHTEVWQEKWAASDVKIEGDDEAQKALRFNIYHMIISGNENDDNVSISARTLSGDGYRGHIFWDTEIFLLPFFIYTNPRVAKNLLMYRFYRLNPARKIAETKGYKGTLYPWESADSGEETTPPYAKNMDGSIIEIHTMDMEHHIVADVAYGAYHYFNATNDMEFMFKAGLEIIFESARFWSSRVTRNLKTKKYEIRKVIGPDEFHEGVDNNVYTNKMAQWNLYKAKWLYENFKKNHYLHLRRIERKIGLNLKESEQWGRIADKMEIPYSKSKEIFEEFTGYLRKKDVPIKNYNRYFMPIIPHDVQVPDIQKTQFVKQADVIMLMYLLPEYFNNEERKKNYLYYIKRTLHKSSLSPSIHSIMASDVKDTSRAYLFFLFSLYADLKNTHGNTREGTHAASLGGTWQAVIMGFAGFRIIDYMPSFEPNLPGHWKSIGFSLKWRGYNLNVKVTNREIKFYITSKKKGSMLVKCFNSVYKIPFNKEYLIYR